jgi:hypothetical protein
MKKGLIFLFAALLVVGLPLSALAGTVVTKISKDLTNVGYWQCWFDTSGPGIAYGSKTVCFEWIEDPSGDEPLPTYSETVRFKANKDGTNDLGWNIVGRGKVRVWSLGDSSNVQFSSAAVATKMFRIPKPTNTAGMSVIETAHLQMEEVAQDDGNDAGCDAAAPEWNTCGSSLIFVDNFMLHWKLNGNKYFFFKMTQKNNQWCMSVDPASGENMQCTDWSADEPLTW